MGGVAALDRATVRHDDLFFLFFTFLFVLLFVLFYFTSEGPTARMLLSRAPKKYKDERKDEGRMGKRMSKSKNTRDKTGSKRRRKH